MREQVIEWLRARGVELEDIARVVQELLGGRFSDLTLEECLASVRRVVDKREAQFAILTGIALDVLAEQGHLPEPLRSAVREDSPLYGIDEVLALAITNLYGSVGLTSFGYLDKRKLGIIGQLNRHADGGVHTFLDDLVAGVAAAAAARIAHRRQTLADAAAGSEGEGKAAS
ncbi:phosphatidylglycerophosphatase A [Carboxydochorda subterranea]|uniref:Phosphatidylglycerophosphatase A n=1 Tax=Carboxydichorda subterranea TaxID=3109565 RepID=A0ABZ1BUP3_9FIRM|nr:phosphatidylglycerophosphatase A [Limnochorda sp. L945t]WRP16308.1 phosphatidylglycerophosphatase A [Limnochorda sp. L945t]